MALKILKLYWLLGLLYFNLTCCDTGTSKTQGDSSDSSTGVPSVRTSVDYNFTTKSVQSSVSESTFTEYTTTTPRIVTTREPRTYPKHTTKKYGKIGDRCYSNSDCSVINGWCDIKFGSGTCECKIFYHEVNEYTCTEGSSGLHHHCESDGDCNDVPYSECLFFSCECNHGYYPDYSNNCQPDGTGVHHHCESNTDCYDVWFSHCSMNTCECDSGYSPDDSNKYCQSVSTGGYSVVVYVVPIAGLSAIAVFVVLVYIFYFKCGRKAPAATLSVVRTTPQPNVQNSRMSMRNRLQRMYTIPLTSPASTPEDKPPPYNEAMDGGVSNVFPISLPPPPYNPSMMTGASFSGYDSVPLYAYNAQPAISEDVSNNDSIPLPVPLYAFPSDDESRIGVVLPNVDTERPSVSYN